MKKRTKNTDEKLVNKIPLGNQIHQYIKVGLLQGCRVVLTLKFTSIIYYFNRKRKRTYDPINSYREMPKIFI